ncbi:MAG: hypothetical protein IKA93_04090 [Elusimicrobiaceae bacterium]|nr:hypothetical protein [Elusimicrobiaceae bacterium]
MTEERILIIKLKQKPCYTCNVIRGCAGSCILESKWYSSMTPQEAIDKISFALMMKGVDESDCKELSEAALNALLEVEK